MKKIKNNSYYLAFINSAFSLPFLIFTLVSLLNNSVFLYKNFLDYNWRYFFALFGGWNRDILLFSVLILILSFVCNKIKILKNLSLIVVHLVLCLPIFDYLYFRATLERFNWIVLEFINYHSAKGYIGNMGLGFLFLFLFILLLIISFIISCKRAYFAESYSFKPLVAICIFTFFASFFAHKIVFPIFSIEVEFERKMS